MFIAPEKMVKLVSNDFMRRYLKSRNKNHHEPLLLKQEIIAGGVAGASQSFISTPMDLMKINLQDAGRLSQMNNSSVETSKLSARQIAVDVVKTQGIFSLWRGIGATILLCYLLPCILHY
jgi:solute carrier family 25 glutamate transporter 18/22